MEVYPILGIDLGTCCSCVYGYRGGQLMAVPFGNLNTISSVMYYNDGNMVFGEQAKQLIDTMPELVIYDVKRFIGKSYEEVKDVLSSKQYQFLTDTYRDSLVFCVPNNDGCYAFTAEHIDSYFLRYLVDEAKQFFGYEPEGVVITVPAFFQVAQIDATKRAAQMAGLKVVAVLFEPSAAALACNIPISLDTRYGLIYDLGGGTFDVAVVKTEGSQYDIVSNDGHPFLGGSDFDNIIFNIVVEKLNMRGFNIANWDTRRIGNLQRKAEEMKIELSTGQFTNLDLEDFGLSGDVSISREEFEQRLKPWLDVTMQICKRALERVNISLSKNDFILLVGGSSHIPLVRQLLCEAFPVAPVLNFVNPSEIVANGAALHCLDWYCRMKHVINPIPCPVVHSIVVRPVYIKINNGDPELILPVGSRCGVKVERNYRVHLQSLTVTFWTESDMNNQNPIQVRNGNAPLKRIMKKTIHGFFQTIHLSVAMNEKGELVFEYSRGDGERPVVHLVADLQPDIPPEVLIEIIRKKVMIRRYKEEMERCYNQAVNMGRISDEITNYYNQLSRWLDDDRVLTGRTYADIEAECGRAIAFFQQILGGN